MRFVILLLTGFLIVLAKAPVSGQTGADTLGLTGTMADTVVVNRLLTNVRDLWSKKKYAESKEPLLQAKSICQTTYGPGSVRMANILHALGNVNYAGEQMDSSLHYYTDAFNIRKLILDSLHRDLAQSYNSIGSVYQYTGEFDKAIENHLRALTVKLFCFGEKHIELVRTYYNLGICYENLGRLDLGLSYKRKSLEMCKELLGDNRPETAVYYNGLGVIYFNLRDYARSIECHKKALSIRKTTLGENNVDAAISYNNLGNSYEAVGKTTEALACKKSALEIYRQNLGENHSYVAVGYSNVALSLYVQKKYEESIDLHKKAISIYWNIYKEGHTDLSKFYNNLGLVYFDVNRLDSAAYYFRRAIEMLKQFNGAKSLFLNEYYENLANTLIKDNRYPEAINSLNEYLEAAGFGAKYALEFPNLNLIYAVANAAWFKSGKEYNNLEKAHFYALRALTALDLQYAGLTDDSKAFWLSKNYPIYEQAISVSLLKRDMDQNDTLCHHAFSYAEKSKAALLQAQIKTAGAIHFAGIPDSLLQTEHDLRIDITWREKQRQSLLNKGLVETDTGTLRISSILFDLRRDYEALKQRFETEYPEYYRLKYDLGTVSLQYVQDTLLQPRNQALLEYFVGDSSLYLFVVRPDTLIIRSVKLDFPLESWIEGLRYGIYGYYAADNAVQTDSLKADAKRKYLEFAPKLYQKLMAPVAPYLPEKVILVPDGPLGYVPFDALLTTMPENISDFKSYPYLLHKHQFSYTYSATLLREMRDKKHRKAPKNDFVAFAPYYNGDTTLLAGMFKYDDLMRKDLQPLPASGAEVAAASKLMRGKTIAGAAATEERFTGMAGDYRIIHLATHGHADNRVGDYAFLAFTEIKDSLENELLYVKDLYNLELNADLVVLSACETGIGKLQRGEGIISLARAFAYAGAKSIVTSLWSVADKSTAELMRLFYRELKRGKDKDEALRLARLRFLKESSVRNGHPFFWSAFVPVGDMRPVR